MVRTGCSGCKCGGQCGLGASGTQYATGGASSALAIAAAFDPEPFSKAGLMIASFFTNLFGGMKAKYQAQETATTKSVNQIEPYMKANLTAFQSGQIDKATALANFDALWQQVVQACSDPNLGDPGKRCVSDRQRGGKWDWFSYYRTPIENAPDPAVGGLLSLVPQQDQQYLLPALAAGLLAVVVLS